MNIVISVGCWPEERLDYRSTDGNSGRVQRGRVFFMWSPVLDPGIWLNVSVSIRLSEDLKLEQSLVLRRV